MRNGIRILLWMVIYSYTGVYAQDLSSYTASFLGTHKMERVGYHVHTAGDVNGDGYDDFLVGTTHHSTGAYDRGAAYLILGRAAADWGLGVPLGSEADAKFIGKEAYDALGYCLGGGGDVNGDGYDDILVGAPAGNDYAPHLNGYACIIFGKANPNWGLFFIPADQADATFISESQRDHAGQSVAYAGDINGDGYDDILVSSPFNDQNGTDTGKVYLILGKASGWTRGVKLSNANAIFNIFSPNAQFGYSVDGVGDINGDHVPDFAIGAYGQNKVYLFWGRQNVDWGPNFQASNADKIFYSNNGNGAGWRVSRAGDVNNDGYDDMLIGAPYDNQNGYHSGKVYLILGNNTIAYGDLLLADASFVGEAGRTEAGYDVQEAGDLNGDGYDDFLIGAWEHDTPADSIGKMYVIHGKETGWEQNVNLSTITTYFIGESLGDRAGYSVATAGDVNNDGVNDIVVSESFRDEVAKNAGKILLFVSENVTPEIGVDKTVLNFGTNLTSVNLEIQNIGGGTLNWQCSENPEQSWIVNITPSSGTLGHGQSDVLTVSVTRSGLVNGQYDGVIRVSDPAAANDPVDIPITVNVDAGSYEIGKYRRFETVFSTTNSYTNPYKDVSFGAHVTGPGGISFDTDGFWYGASAWGLRIMPTAIGHWTFTTVSSDPQLNGIAGEFECVASGHPGMLEVNPTYPYSFRFSEGDPFLWNGETNWCLMSNAVPFDDGTFKQYIDTRLSQNFNGIHFVLGTGGLPVGTHNPENEGGPLWTNPATQLINPLFFEWMDKRMAYLDSVQMTIGFFMTWAQDYIVYSQADFERFERYMIARYGAYPMLYWVIVGEFDEEGTIAGYNYHGMVFEMRDPYRHLTSIHPGHSDPLNLGTSRIFHDQPWFDFIIQQIPDKPGSYGPDYLNDALLADRIYDMPVVNIEYGYEDNVYDAGTFTANQIRKSAWAVNMAGGPASYGHIGTFRDINFLVINSDGAAYVDNLYQFFAGLVWWTFGPANHMIENGYCLKNPAEEYIFYAPDSGEVALNFQSVAGSFQATWYNPIDRSTRIVSSFNGGSQIVLATPFEDDAVLHVVPNYNTAIVTDPMYLLFEAVEGMANPADQLIRISNTIAGPLNWTAAENPDVPWLQLSNASGIAGGQLTASVDISGRSAGVYVTDIRITENNSINSPLDVLVRLDLNPNVPLLSVTPELLDFGYFKTSMTVTVRNVGGGELFWSLAESPDRYWIIGVSPNSGSLLFGESQPVTVSVNRSGLADGVYWGALRCQTNDGVDTVDVKVSATQDAILPEKIAAIWGEKEAPDGVRLEWSESDYTTHYNVYRGTTPFFTPTTPVSSVTTTYYVDAGYAGDPATNYFYVVTAANQYGESDYSDRIGEFDFGLITTPTTDFNEIALPLIMPGIQKASDLLLAIPNCNSVARWNANFQGYRQFSPSIPSTNFDVYPGHAYYVNVSAPGVFTLVGSYTEPLFDLVTTPTTDFNDIMLPLNKHAVLRASDLLVDIPSCNSVARWNAAFQGYRQFSPSIPSTNFDVFIGYPYYVNVASNTQWPAMLTKMLAGESEQVNMESPTMATGVPHLVFGRIDLAGKSSDEVVVRAYLNGDRENYLTTHDAGCSLEDDGYFWIQCSQFAAGWTEGDLVAAEVIDRASGKVIALLETRLSHEPVDELLMLQQAPVETIEEFSVYRNYPNPFNLETTISYAMPDAGHVLVAIYNTLGQRIRTLVDESQPAGRHSVIWDATDESSASAASGVYFCRIRYEKENRVQKMILMR